MGQGCAKFQEKGDEWYIWFLVSLNQALIILGPKSTLFLKTLGIKKSLWD